MRGEHRFDGLDCDPTTSAKLLVKKGVTGIINFIKDRYMREETQQSGALVPSISALRRRYTCPSLDHLGQALQLYRPSAVPLLHSNYGRGRASFEVAAIQ
jgi:hypothetical protein